MDAASYNQRLVKAAERLREAQATYDTRIKDHVTAERLYKLGESMALLRVEGRNAEERAARAEMLAIQVPDANGEVQEVTVNGLRYAAHLAEGLRDSAKKAVDNYRQEMSALQSLASLAKSEAELAKWESRETVPA